MESDHRALANLYNRFVKGNDPVHRRSCRPIEHCVLCTFISAVEVLQSLR